MTDLSALRELYRRSLLRGACARTGHDRYPDQSDAEQALELARLAAAAGLRHRRECRSYWCRFCDGWHLTSDPSAQRDGLPPVTRGPADTLQSPRRQDTDRSPGE